MKTKIVVDSSSSLYALPGVDFACVPLKIVTDEQEYLDDGTLVGRLLPAIDSGLGHTQKLNARLSL